VLDSKGDTSDELSNVESGNVGLLIGQW
jgi:hypothetical protein